ncbi:MAG: DUF802 domain-containing protein [Gammaproteobacteria bacterium]|nr:DUF802 domain-containing protein [Gammaproteobacteria bacterium]
MTRILSAAAFLLGAIIVVWMGSAFVGSNLLALIVTLVIAAVYCVGYGELWRYQQTTASLAHALHGLTDKITDLNGWLQRLPASLQNSVRQRIEGQQAGLPAPVLAPYLIGLLVMLGLLGTFVGMVDTLKGAVMALEGTSELEAIRAGLAAPIKGLGMAFGTSVAGVAASAMLGFIATLSRRERMLAARLLDSKIGTVLQDHSLAYNRQQTFNALQAQAQALPQVAEKLTLLIEQVGRMSDQVSDSLIRNQDQFHHNAEHTYRELASSIDQSLQQSLAASGRLAVASIEPAVKELLQGMNQAVTASQQQLTDISQRHLDTISTQFAATSSDMSSAWQAGLAAQDQANGKLVEQLSHSLERHNQQFAGTCSEVNSAWQAGLAAHEQANDKLIERVSQSLENYNSQFNSASAGLLASFSSASSDWLQRQQAADEDRLQHWSAALERSATALQETASRMAATAESGSSQMIYKIGALLQASESLVQTRIDSEASWLDSHEQRVQQLSSTLEDQLLALRSAEEERGDKAIARLDQLEAAVAEHLGKLGQALEEPMTRLIETASETPRAAAEVIAKLRAEISNSIERDNSLLDERRRTMAELSQLSGAMQQSAQEQRDAIEQLVNSAADMLQGVGSRFSDSVGSEAVKLADVVDHFAGSATELSSLGEAFGTAVRLFNDANGQLIDSLGRIEESLQNSSTRSDEQLAYYVAQAREIIDQSMLSQQDIIDQLRQLSDSSQRAAEVVN